MGFPGLWKQAILWKQLLSSATLQSLASLLKFSLRRKTERKKRNCHLQLQTPKPSGAPDTWELLKLLEDSFLIVAGLFHLQFTSQVFSSPMRIMLSVIYTTVSNLWLLAIKQVLQNKASPSLSISSTDGAFINGFTFSQITGFHMHLLKQWTDISVK